MEPRTTSTQRSRPISSSCTKCWKRGPENRCAITSVSLFRGFYLLINQIAGIGNDIRSGFEEFRDGGWFSSLFENIKSDIDDWIAFSVDYHVIKAYTYLMRYYVEGDKIYLFGFSRGSFISRILAGMIERIGLLNQGLEVMVGTAWEIYRKWEEHGQPIGHEWTNSSANVFKKTFCREKVDIKFMGLWDSVNSCGIIRDRLFPYASVTHHVEHVRHAVSIDERRAKFKQNLFIPHSYLPSLFTLNCVDEDDHQLDDDFGTDELTESSHLLPVEADYVNRTNAYASRLVASPNDLVELWFPGDHSDVGGGWINDLDGHSVANLPFRWILASAIELGVLFKRNSVHEFATKFSSLDSLLSCHHDCLHLRRRKPVNHNLKCLKASTPLLYTTTSAALASSAQITSISEEMSALSNDDLFANPSKNITELPSHTVSRFDGRGTDTAKRCLFWWLVEVLPVGYFVENKNAKWRRIYYPNFGRRRSLPRTARLHWTTLWRAKVIDDYFPENLPEKYKPLFELVKAENEGVDDMDDDCDCQVITNENLIDRTTGEIRADCLVCDPDKKIRLEIRWNEIPDDLAFWLDKDHNL
ncbi:hypothetical protein OGAPHI_002814 [Ogataea philodendri]|uniref:T6SS Phospholipase effector Tle1-like catalytic domain-containing protein n=1 Tax=Ogataea philodendri TaxID=1378263 RepID=A0A9P8P8W8_9ASCO|nr:uncharacterized protein OGAPHI_002814 [Ogataea philodendri]KAH3667165.1 hypothetical protein OGAPHI_002814 [Ogataea philodendri]